MPKQNWDQLVILCEEKRPRYINGKEIPNWQEGPTVSEAVNYLGWKGWLLFSDSSAVWLGYGKLTLIRPEQLVILCEEKRPRYINGKEIPNWREGPTISEAVDYLARKGWLLRSDPSPLRLGYVNWQLGNVKLTFIRPKQ